MSVSQFVITNPSDQNIFRSIVLFGRNVASYKFALAQSLLEFAAEGKERVSLAELAAPYSRELCRHLGFAPKQVTSGSSRFLTACKDFNLGKIKEDQLLDVTTQLGFQNVIDAFHRVGTEDVPVRFFVDERRSPVPSIVITEEMINLAKVTGSTSLAETEARWRLVETAWEIGTATTIIDFDSDSQHLVLQGKRTSVTSARSALNGYQKGSCFYCYRQINVLSGLPDLADVDHLFPHVLERRGLTSNLNGIWNLVLACQTCNRGHNGKFDATPHHTYIERLKTRNEYLISSHHPLRETLIKQTGTTVEQRRNFLQERLNAALTYQAVPWQTEPVGLSAF